MALVSPVDAVALVELRDYSDHAGSRSFTLTRWQGGPSGLVGVRCNLCGDIIARSTSSHTIHRHLVECAPRFVRSQLAAFASDAMGWLHLDQVVSISARAADLGVTFASRSDACALAWLVALHNEARTIDPELCLEIEAWLVVDGVL